MDTIPLTDEMYALSIRTIQLATMAPGFLSRHIADTVIEVVDRGLEFGQMACTTNTEWAVVRTAHDDLVRHFAQDQAA